VEFKKSGYKSVWAVKQNAWKTDGGGGISKVKFTCEPKIFTINTKKL
jgi:hypothetical protein